MSGEIANPPVNIGVYSVRLKDNAKSNGTAFDHVETYGNTAGGVYKLSKTVGQAANLFGLPNIGKPVLNGAYGTIYVRALTTGIKTVKDIKNVVQNPSAEHRDEAISTTCGFLSALGYSTFGITGSTAALRVGDSFGLAEDTMGLVKARKEYVAVAGLEEALAQTDAPATVTDEMKTAISETKKLNMYKVLKEVTAVVAGIFGILALALGGPLIPAVILLTISFASSVFSIVAEMYKASMKHHLSIEQKVATL